MRSFPIALLLLLRHDMPNFEAIGDKFSSVTDTMDLILMKDAVQTRSENLESLGYVMTHFCQGSLPWQWNKARNEHEKIGWLWR